MTKMPRPGEYADLIKSLRRQLETAELEVAKQKWLVNKLLTSPSWRLTRPIRWMANQVRSLRCWVKPSLPKGTKRKGEAAIGNATELDVDPAPQAELASRFTDHQRIFLRALLSSSAVVRFPNSDSPEVSVILIPLGRAELTLACLRSLEGPSFKLAEIIVIDNVSSGETLRLLERIEGARIVKTNEKKSLSSASNEGVQQSRGQYLLFVIDDAELLVDSLASALETLKESPDTGVVCGRVIRFDSLLEEAGTIIWSDATYLQYGFGDDPFAPMYMFRREVDSCSAAFMLTPRTVWQRVGGFDETFVSAYYVEDYCARVWEHGLRIIYDPNAIILRHGVPEPVSSGNGNDVHREQREMFGKKHLRLLTDQLSRDNVVVAKARIRNRKKNHLLFLEDRVPHAWLGVGLPRTRSILLSILKQNYFVTFYPLNVVDEEWSSVYSDMPADVEFMVGLGRPALEIFLNNRRGEYETIFVSRPHNMVSLRSVIAKNPDWFRNVKLVYDTEALFASREISRRRLEGSPLSEEQCRRLIEEEVALASVADLVICVSEPERAIFRMHGIEHVTVLGHAMMPKPTPRPFEERKGFLFVGTIHEGLSPNGDSIVWFLTEIFPRIREKLSYVTATIVGANNSEKIGKLAGSGVSAIAHAKDLTDLYNSARVFVAPTRYAAGIPHKVHEAAAYGLPVVATSLLANQLGWQYAPPIAVADDADSFAKKCVEIYTDKAAWSELRISALRRVQVECSLESFDHRVKEILAGSG